MTDMTRDEALRAITAYGETLRGQKTRGDNVLIELWDHKLTVDHFRALSRPAPDLGRDSPYWGLAEKLDRLAEVAPDGMTRRAFEEASDAIRAMLHAAAACDRQPAAPAPGSAEVEALCERLEAGDAAADTTFRDGPDGAVSHDRRCLEAAAVIRRRQAEELRGLREGRLEGIWSQARENHERYSATGSVEQDIRFFGLGLAGEAGEVANFIKKRWRDGDGHDADLRAECADVLAYTMMLAHALGMTPEGLIAEVARKQEVFIEKMRARALLNKGAG